MKAPMKMVKPIYDISNQERLFWFFRSNLIKLCYSAVNPSGATTGMMTSSNGNIFRVTGHLCGEFTGPGEFPAQRPVTRSFDVFFGLRLNKRLSKQTGD